MLFVRCRRFRGIRGVGLALPTANSISRVRLEGSGPRGIRSARNQGAKREQGGDKQSPGVVCSSGYPKERAPEFRETSGIKSGPIDMSRLH